MIKIFVINLKKSTDRRANVTSQMKKLGVDFEFIDGVDGRELSQSYVDSVFDKETAQKIWKPMTRGEIGCSLSHISIYKKMIKRADNSADNQTLKSHLQEADWLIKSLQHRSETLLNVSTCIVEHQCNFLEHGEEAMKPLILQDIASALDLHESTISRATTRKYIHTPRGTYELKYFFASHVETDHGGSRSSTAIRALIKKLIDNELPDKPLSDNNIATLLKKEGINVARRTIAKYREGMAIPPSNERKRMSK